jgi:hypothetical protein
MGGEEIRDELGRPTGLFREPEGLRYRIQAVDVFGPDEYLAQPDPAFYIGARYRRAIECSVRTAPEQYLWMHRYWKSRPRWNRRGRTMPPTVLKKLRDLPWMTDSELDRIIEWDRRDAAEYARQAAHAGSSVANAKPSDDRASDGDTDAEGEALTPPPPYPHPHSSIPTASAGGVPGAHRLDAVYRRIPGASLFSGSFLARDGGKLVLESGCV